MLSGAVERIICREVVKNIICHLMVEKGEASPGSMDEFFGLSILKYFPGRIVQLQQFGSLLDPVTKSKWARPEVKNVSELDDIHDIIPTVMINHYEDVAQGGVSYYSPHVSRSRQNGDN